MFFHTQHPDIFFFLGKGIEITSNKVDKFDSGGIFISFQGVGSKGVSSNNSLRFFFILVFDMLILSQQRLFFQISYYMTRFFLKKFQ